MSPTKSGVLGLVAAALGLQRTDPLGELLGLRYGVRIDRPGRLLRDFQTAQRPQRKRGGTTEWKRLPISQHYYVADAVFLALLEGERSLLDTIDAAVRSPVFPLYLGRRFCPPAGPVALGVFDDDIDTAFTQIGWLASVREQKRHREQQVELGTVRDALPEEADADQIRDVPLSFDPNRRQYGWRRVRRDFVVIPNPQSVVEPAPEHDPMALLGE